MTLGTEPFAPNLPAPVRVREVLRESRHLFRHNAGAIMRPMAAIQMPLAVVGAMLPWVLYSTIYSDQSKPFDADSLTNGPRALLFTLVAVAWVWMLAISLGVNSTVMAVRDAREGVRHSLPELLDPSFTHLGGLIVVAMGGAGLMLATLVTSLTVLAPLVLLFTMFRLGLSVHWFALEEPRPWAAATGSWRLMRGNTVRLAGVLTGSLPVVLLMALAGFFALLVISVPFAVMGTARGPLLAANAVGTIALAAILVPIYCYVTTTTTVFYLHLKENAHD